MNLEIQLPAFVTILAVLFTFLASARVGALRVKHKIEAPATVGHPEFERAIRVHMNTIESLVLFLPLLWLASLLYSSLLAPALGGIWLIGRVIYMVGYMSEAAKRGPGAIITMLATAGLLILAVIGLVG